MSSISKPLNYVKCFIKKNTTYLTKMVEYDKCRFKSKEKSKYIRNQLLYRV